MDPVERLLAIWERTTLAERLDGRDWYPSALAFADSLAFWTDTPLNRVIGVIAALSPQLTWEKNCEAAKKLVSGEPLSGVLGASVQRARAILDGRYPDATAFALRTSPKTNSFYHNIRAPLDPRFVTIDRHAARAAGEHWARFDYWRVAAVYQEAAKRVGEVPCAFQATIWTFQRNGGQLALPFRSRKSSKINGLDGA